MILRVLRRSRGGSKLPTTLKKEGKLKDKMAARGAGCTKKGGNGGGLRKERFSRKKFDPKRNLRKLPKEDYY